MLLKVIFIGRSSLLYTRYYIYSLYTIVYRTENVTKLTSRFILILIRDQAKHSNWDSYNKDIYMKRNFRITNNLLKRILIGSNNEA